MYLCMFALLGADVNLQRVEGGLWKSTNSDESGYVNFWLLYLC